jgi:hypothetical protein
MLRNKLRVIITIPLMLGVFGFLVFPFVFAADNQSAQQAEQPKREVFAREVTGEIAGISSNFIAVIYGQTDKESLEMALPMDKTTKGSIRKLSEIKLGDMVSVTYEETVETKKDEKPRITKRLAKVVEFRRAASVAAPEGSVLENK